MSRRLIFGATSAIAEATARIWAARGDTLFLVGLNEQQLNAIAKDLLDRGAGGVSTVEADLTDRSQHAQLVSSAAGQMEGIDTVLIAHGLLGDQEKAQTDFDHAMAILDVNFLSAASLLSEVANCFEEQKSGSIAVISSVAGDRGRQSNYVYGAAKGGLSIFLEGLRNRMFHCGGNVLTIKPGFVDSPMTAHLEKGLLFASPETIAAGIVKAIDKKKNIAYLPFYWRIIMRIVKCVPEPILKRLKM
jgi:short-subunit dehydrogenase